MLPGAGEDAATSSPEPAGALLHRSSGRGRAMLLLRGSGGLGGSGAALALEARSALVRPLVLTVLLSRLGGRRGWRCHLVRGRPGCLAVGPLLEVPSIFIGIPEGFPTRVPADLLAMGVTGGG